MWAVVVVVVVVVVGGGGVVCLCLGGRCSVGRERRVVVPGGVAEGRVIVPLILYIIIVVAAISARLRWRAVHHKIVDVDVPATRAAAGVGGVRAIDLSIIKGDYCCCQCGDAREGVWRR